MRMEHAKMTLRSLVCEFILKKKKTSHIRFVIFGEICPIFRFVNHLEFAALLLNTKSGLVESIFHHFVRPSHFPTLSAYCTNQTGLEQTFIDQQKSFECVYNKFISWLRQHIVKRNLVFATPQSCQQHTPSSNAGLNATFCTWSDWDLGHYLYRDCIRNEIVRYECMKAWIDIRRAFDVSRWAFS